MYTHRKDHRSDHSLDYCARNRPNTNGLAGRGCGNAAGCRAQRPVFVSDRLSSGQSHIGLEVRVRHFLLTLAIALPLIIAATPARPHSIGDIVAPHKGDPCSACRMVVYKRPQHGLPAVVQKMRLAIIDLAIHCKPLQLEKLATPGRRHFDFTFNGEKKAGPFWVKRELTGHRTLGKFVTTLHLPYAHDGHIFIWPSAYGKNPQDRDWDALREIYAERDCVLFQNYGGFTGMRLAIADDGEWLYAIEGD
jgi:hypothetical protein